MDGAHVMARLSWLVMLVIRAITREVHADTLHSMQLSAGTFTTKKQQLTIHQVISMLATSKDILFPGHNHLLTTGTDDPTL